MTVKQLKKKLNQCEDDQMVLITDGKGWCNIEKVLTNKFDVYIVQETNAVFQES